MGSLQHAPTVSDPFVRVTAPPTQAQQAPHDLAKSFVDVDVNVDVNVNVNVNVVIDADVVAVVCVRRTSRRNALRRSECSAPRCPGSVGPVIWDGTAGARALLARIV